MGESGEKCELRHTLRWLSKKCIEREKEAAGRKCEFDHITGSSVRFPKVDDLALTTSHLAQSSSASRFTAGAFEFFILSQSGERPER